MFSLSPLLHLQRDIYRAHPRGMKRFRGYLVAVLDGTDRPVNPLVMFNPMGRDHVRETAEALLAIDAERIAADALATADRRLPGAAEMPALTAWVVVCDHRGSWSNQPQADLGFRFNSTDDDLGSRFGCLILAWWTDRAIDASGVRALALESADRARHRQIVGPTATLGDLLVQEGRALRFAGVDGPTLDDEELAYTRAVIDPLRGSADPTTVMAALHGDAAARGVGYAPLGLSTDAGLALALAEARESPVEPERVGMAGVAPAL